MSTNPGHTDSPRRIYRARGLIIHLPDCDDPAAGHGDVRLPARGARTVDDVSALDQKVQHQQLACIDDTALSTRVPSKKRGLVLV